MVTKMERIAVVGVGYVGLVSATCLAEVGHHVICLDIDSRKVEQLKNGGVPIFEPGLEPMVQRNIAEGRLTFTTKYSEAIPVASIAILAVDTPPDAQGRCDLKNLRRAALSIADAMTGDLLVVIKSTVPVGTCRHIEGVIRDRLRERCLDAQIEIVSNPEFLREGAAVHDFMHPDRVIIGVSSERAEERMRDLYQPFRHDREKVIIMDTASSEMTKYASNTMLACRISFMNWLSRLCEATGADIGNVKAGMGSDSRIGGSFLRAGIGFGGSCFPKDIRALRWMAQEQGIPSALVEAIDATNEEQKLVLSQKIIRFFEQRSALPGAVVAVLGLAFKPETDDMREAPSLVLIQQLVDAGATVRLFDPVAMDNAKRLIPPSPAISWCENEWEAVSGADAVALATEWSRFRAMDLHRLRSVMRGNAYFDGRNIFSPEEMANSGFDYFSIGRQPVQSLPPVEAEPTPEVVYVRPFTCS
jgi:UDPglucose 6-dehydrogenase